LHNDVASGDFKEDEIVKEDPEKAKEGTISTDIETGELKMGGDEEQEKTGGDGGQEILCQCRLKN
jgi:hypothetical protein